MMAELAEGALGDVRVLELTGEMGAYCGKLLADLGADVIKIEPPGGSYDRRIGPFLGDRPHPERGLAFLNKSTSKRSVTLDLHREDGRALFRRLVRRATVVLEDFPPGYLSALGLGYEALAKIRPDLVMTSVTGFGQDGPHAGYLAPDIVGVAMAGIMTLAGDPADPPNRPYGNQGYHTASIIAAAATTTALYYRDVTGEGQHVDVSMQEALSLAQETAIQTWDLQRRNRARTGGLGAIPIQIPGAGVYECSDGHVFFFVVAPGGAPWPALLDWMAEEGQAADLAEEPYRELIDKLDMAFLTQVMTDPDSAAGIIPQLTHINQVLQAFCKAHGKWELYEGGQGRRLLVGIASTPKDIVESPQLAARRWFQDVDLEYLGARVPFPGPPYRLSETPATIRRRPPRIGEHNQEIYCAELGLGVEELGALQAAGVI